MHLHRPIAPKIFCQFKLFVLQLASLAASYMTKHIHFHTDACVNAELTDQVFKLMLVKNCVPLLIFFILVE